MEKGSDSTSGVGVVVTERLRDARGGLWKKLWNPVMGNGRVLALGRT